MLQTGRNNILKQITTSLTSSLPPCFQKYKLLPQARDGCLRPSWCWRRSCPSQWNDSGFGIVPKAWQFGCLDLWLSWICLETLSRLLWSLVTQNFDVPVSQYAWTLTLKRFVNRIGNSLLLLHLNVSVQLKGRGRTPLLATRFNRWPQNASSSVSAKWKACF